MITGQLREIVSPLHRRTSRDYLPRMVDDKVRCMEVAREYEFDYWDGDRRYGYGGYRYDGRWRPAAEQFISAYGLQRGAAVLDVGCGKGHLLYELQQLIPEARVAGIDRSRHAVADVPESLRTHVQIGRAQDPLPWPDRHFDLVISLATLHNLKTFELAAALREIERVGRRKYVMVESYRSPRELFNLQCWALTAETFFDPDEWVWFFGQCGYTGDYEFIYFE